jgi:hypothetical protein
MLKKSLNLKISVLFCMLIFSGLVIYSVTPANDVSGQETTLVTEPGLIFFPLIYRNFDATLGTPLIGLQMYGNTSNTNIYHPYLVDSGASWLRVPIYWKNIQLVDSDPPVYNWSSADAALAAAKKDMGEFNIIATFETIPDWAVDTMINPPGELVRTDKLDALAVFLAAAVERYDGDGIDDAPGSPRIINWEITNEPDASINNAKWGNYGSAYAHMLSVIYPTMKAANPETRVLFGGIAYDWFVDQGGNFNRDFLTDVLAAGGGNYFDVMNFHAYPVYASNWTSGNGPGLLEKSQAVRSVLANYGHSKPLIITEAGWHDNSPPNPILQSSPEIQARYVVQLLTQSYAAKLETMIWWMLYDIGGNYPYTNGLITWNSETSQMVEKVAYGAFQGAAEELATTHYTRKLSVNQTGSNDLEVHEFRDNTKNLIIYVAWLNPIKTTSSNTLRLAATEVLVRESVPNQPGAELRTYIIRDHNDGVVDGQVTVTVGGRPLYIEVKK